jgi:hypothetical protein
VALVHGGPQTGPRWWLIGARPSSHFEPRRLTDGGAMERGLHGELDGPLTGDRAAVMQPSDGGE